jgi:hypothetical protein
MLALKNGFKCLNKISSLIPSTSVRIVVQKRFYSKNDEFDLVDVQPSSNMKRKPVVLKGVKLYPGHQKSFEEKSSELEGKFS